MYIVDILHVNVVYARKEIFIGREKLFENIQRRKHGKSLVEVYSPDAG